MAGDAKKKLGPKDKQAAVYGLKLRGLNYAEIQRVYVDPETKRPHYATRSAVYKAFLKEVDRRTSETTAYRSLNVDRIDHIVSLLMPDAKQPKVASVIDKLIRTQSVLLGLVKGPVDDAGIGANGQPALPTGGTPANTYANWATDSDLVDAGDVMEGEYEELEEE